MPIWCHIMLLGTFGTPQSFWNHALAHCHTLLCSTFTDSDNDQRRLQVVLGYFVALGVPIANHQLQRLVLGLLALCLVAPWFVGWQEGRVPAAGAPRGRGGHDPRGLGVRGLCSEGARNRHGLVSWQLMDWLILDLIYCDPPHNGTCQRDPF